jgi:N-acetylneuraminate synthase
MIEIAKSECKCDFVKFQKRTPKELLSFEEYNSPHPNEKHSYGNSYGEHREYLEFTLEQHIELKRFCDDIGIGYSTSVWDLTAAREMLHLQPECIKIPSACNLNKELIRFICTNFNGDIHISVGMTTKKEEEGIVHVLSQYDALERTILYACTSGYPVMDEEVCLYEITRLKKTYGSDVKAIGYSGHHLGTIIDISAYTLGATWIERHFTLDKTWKGTDHAVSLIPEEMRSLKLSLKHVDKALTFKSKDILPVEKIQRKKLKRHTLISQPQPLRKVKCG